MISLTNVSVIKIVNLLTKSSIIFFYNLYILRSLAAMFRIFGYRASELKGRGGGLMTAANSDILVVDVPLPPPTRISAYCPLEYVRTGSVYLT